jgi:hypothetical protein
MYILGLTLNIFHEVKMFPISLTPAQNAKIKDLTLGRS